MGTIKRDVWFIGCNKLGFLVVNVNFNLSIVIMVYRKISINLLKISPERLVKTLRD